jgi:phage/plasmid-associated DNA primase
LVDDNHGFGDVDIDGANDDVEVSEELLESLEDFDGDSLDDVEIDDSADDDGNTDGGTELSEPVRVARKYVEALTGIEHTVEREPEYGRDRVKIKSPVFEVKVEDANGSSDADIAFAFIKGGFDEYPESNERPQSGPKWIGEMRDVIDERGREDLKPASAFEDNDAGTGDRGLVTVATEYYNSLPSVQRVAAGDDVDDDDRVAGHGTIVTYRQNGNRLSTAVVLGDDTDAAGDVVPELATQQNPTVIVEDGCADALNWVADSISIIDRSEMQTYLTDTDDTVNDDGEPEDSDDSDEVGVKSIPELADYMTPKEMWGDASTFYADQNPGQAREMVAGALMAEMDWLCIRESSEYNDYDLRVYVPERGCYVENGGGVLEERMTQVLGGLATKGAEISKIKQLVANNCKVDADETDAQQYEETLIPFENGVLVLDSVAYDADTGTIDPATAELRDKNPEYNFLHSLPVEWDPDTADLDLVEQWMGDMTAGEEVKSRTLWEAGGHALLPRYEPQGFIIAIAEGSNGKTTLFNVFLEALGEGNTTAIPLDKITDSQFSTYRMVDRLMNMHADISGATLDDVSALKAATGDDRMEVERKGIDPWDERNRATQLMAANSPPTIVEQNKAVKRRLMPVILDVEFVTDADPENPYQVEKDPEMEDRLTEDSALAAIVLKFVEAARRLQEQQEFSMALEYDGDERMRIYESYADPIADFERSCMERDPDGPGIAVDDIKACYDAFSVDKDHPEKKRSTLIDMLKKRATTVMRRSDPRSWTDDDSRIGVYKGMKFSEKAKENWLPEDAYWDKYGRPDTDDVSTDGTATVEDDRLLVEEAREMDPTRVDDKHLRVKVAYELDPRPWLHDETVVKDGSDTMRVQSIGEHELDEGETYVIEDATIIPEDGDNHLQLVPAQTSVTKIDTASDQSGLPEDDDGDDDNGEVVNESNDSDTTTADSAGQSEAAESKQTTARTDGGGEGNSEEIDEAVLRNAERADSAAALAGVVSQEVSGADLGKINHRVEKLASRGDIILDGESDPVESSDSDPELPAGVMQSHHVQCRECGNWWPIVAPNGHFSGFGHTECESCGTPVDWEWNIEHRSLNSENVPPEVGGE